MDIFTVVAMGVVLAAIAFVFQPTRKLVGYVLAVGGVALCLTGVGFPVGVPMALVGAVVLYFDYSFKRHHMRHHTQQHK